MSEMAYIAMEEGRRAGHKIGKRLRKAWTGHHHDVFLADALERMAVTYCDGDPERMRHLADRLQYVSRQLETAADRTPEPA